MKNYDLIWAREHAGLTQEQAAAKICAHRVTFARWEIGAVAMPKRKWLAFLAAIDVDQKDVPKRREYDASGYPVGFKREEALHDDDDGMYDREDARLLELEGDEFPARSRERYRLCMVNMKIPADQIDAEMARYDADEAAARAAGADLV